MQFWSYKTFLPQFFALHSAGPSRGLAWVGSLQCRPSTKVIIHKSSDEVSLKPIQGSFSSNIFKLKPLQNKKGQNNLGYPRKKQSFYKKKDCFFLGYPKFFWPFLFWSGFRYVSSLFKEKLRKSFFYPKYFYLHTIWGTLLKPLQNKKSQKNLGYPRKKQSFSL